MSQTMRFKKFAYCLFVLSLCVPWVTRAETFKAVAFKLDNGLDVIVLENHKAPIVQQALFYKVGAVDEEIGKGGIAHLLEHLMFRGTKRVEGQKFNRVMEENGAESNAFTAQDVTVYHQFMDISRLELAMFLEADRMCGLKISEKDFASERDIVYQERKQRVDNNPAAKFYEKLRKVLWQEHPYGNPITGQDTEILSLTKDDALRFYRRYYAPNNAVLVLAGDIDVATAKKLAEKYYGDLETSEITRSEFVTLPEDYKARIEMSLPQVRLGRLVKMFAVPSFRQDKAKAYAYEVLSEYLSGDENAPLYQRLVLKDKKALSVDVAYNGVARSYGSFVLSAVPVGEPDYAFEKAIGRAWAEALRTLDEDKLEKVKQKIWADLVYMQDNPADLAQTIGYMAATGTGIEVLQNYAANIAKVSLQDVKNVADELWQTVPQATGVLYAERGDEE